MKENAASVILILNDCTCDENCPLREQCNLNMVIYEKDICTALKEKVGD